MAKKVWSPAALGPKATFSCKKKKKETRLLETLRSAAARLAARGWEGAFPGGILSGLMSGLCYRYRHGCTEPWGCPESRGDLPPRLPVLAPGAWGLSQPRVAEWRGWRC